MSIKGPHIKKFASALAGATVTGLFLQYHSKTESHSKKTWKNFSGDQFNNRSIKNKK